MLIRRLLLVAVSAAALGGAITISAATGPTSVAAGPTVTTHTQLTAAFLAEAKAALVKDLHQPDHVLLTSAPRPAAIGQTVAVNSYNWAGYADVTSTAGTYTHASGSWTVPAVTCTSEDRSTSEWVGLDGWTTNTVEQAGTSSQCFQGVALYYSWYEMWPTQPSEIEVGTTVAPGDSITASVTRSGTSYTLALTDSTNTANSFSTVQTCAATTCLDESAEFITERPEFSTTGIMPEAQFGTDKFTNLSVTPLNVSGIYQITCQDSTQTYPIVSTSAVIGGNSFTNTWDNSY